MPINETHLRSPLSIASARPASRAGRTLSRGTETGAVEASKSTESIASRIAHRLGVVVSVFAIAKSEFQGGREAGDVASRLARIEAALDNAIASAAAPEDADVLSVGQGLLADIRMRLTALNPMGATGEGGEMTSC